MAWIVERSGFSDPQFVDVRRARRMIVVAAVVATLPANPGPADPLGVLPSAALCSLEYPELSSPVIDACGAIGLLDAQAAPIVDGQLTLYLDNVLPVEPETELYKTLIVYTQDEEVIDELVFAADPDGAAPGRTSLLASWTGLTASAGYTFEALVAMALVGSNEGYFGAAGPIPGVLFIRGGDPFMGPVLAAIAVEDVADATFPRTASPGVDCLALRRSSLGTPLLTGYTSYHLGVTSPIAFGRSTAALNLTRNS